jgi:integrase
MARPRKPWRRKGRNAWFVEINGKQHNLGPDKDEAMRQYHALMANPEPEVVSDHLAVILDKYLTWVKKERPSSYRWYFDYCQAFILEYPDLLVHELKPYHVEEWASKGKAKRGKITAIKRAMNWAEEMGYVDRSPIAKMKRPEVGVRDQIIEPAEFTALLTKVKDQAFRDLLEFSWETGARPQESKGLESRHVDLEKHCCVLPYMEAKGKKKTRVVFLNKKALAIVERRITAQGDGFVFLNTRGNPWKAGAVKDRFTRLESKVGKKFRSCHRSTLAAAHGKKPPERVITCHPLQPHLTD